VRQQRCVDVVAQDVEAGVRKRLAERTERRGDQQEVPHPEVDAKEQHPMTARQVQCRWIDGLPGCSARKQAEERLLQAPLQTYAEFQQRPASLLRDRADVK